MHFPNLKLLLLICLTLLLTTTVMAKTVTGWVEPALLLPAQIRLFAKLDTGARHSSLNSRNIVIFNRKGTDIVRFNVTTRDGIMHTLELPLVKYTTIKRHFGNSQKRPVVEMEVCIGTISKKVQVNLVDRSGFNFQILLGRSFLKYDILVDSSRKKLTVPQC